MDPLHAQWDLGCQSFKIFHFCDFMCLIESSTAESQTSSSRLSDACAQYLTGEGLGEFAFILFVISPNATTSLMFPPLQYISF